MIIPSSNTKFCIPIVLKAAEELGFIKNGVAKVRVEILEDESRKYALSEQQNVYVAEAAEITEISKKNLLPSPEFEEKNIKKKMKMSQKIVF